MPKPIEDIKEDLQSVIFSINKLQLDMNEIKEITKDIKKTFSEYIVNYEKVDKEKIKPKGWFY